MCCSKGKKSVAEVLANILLIKIYSLISPARNFLSSKKGVLNGHNTDELSRL